ncbi:MAG: hypothetical protein JWP65_2898 [Ramlibacter sp.]|jgi:hypothetical protein|uniref:hypothetical protein n=1 Tax=Ramlibacter sp. TaxID=1917967 RepID=UPI00262232EF|nr:hypothetical protein [Ramlibacter sp.]MDB5752477.1 hypothetical protein [Ramlibacter sp.]
MAIALPVLPDLFASLQSVFGWFTGTPAVPLPAAPIHTTVRASAPLRRSADKPLRVVRVLDPSASRAVAGRMVISGRLADVCAELDRLVAQESRGC